MHKRKCKTRPSSPWNIISSLMMRAVTRGRGNDNNPSPPVTCQSQQTTPIQSKPSPALHLFSFKKRFTWIQYLNHKWACHLTQIITPAGARSAYYEGKYNRAWKIDVIWLYNIDFCSSPFTEVITLHTNTRNLLMKHNEASWDVLAVIS